MEMLVCLSLLGSVSVLLGTQAFALLAQYRFQQGLDRVVLELWHSRIEALSCPCDIECVLSLGKKGIEVEFIPDSPFLFAGQKSTFRVPGADALYWQGRSVSCVHLSLLAAGRIEPSGVLGLGRGEERKVLDLAYPAFFLSTSDVLGDFIQ